MAKRIQHLLHTVDPFSGFKTTPELLDLQGWGSDHQFFLKLLQALRPSTVIEVGTWKGRSAIHMANLSKSLGLATEIVCVDTFLGSPEHITNKDFYPSLRHINGFPTLFYTFINNVILSEVQDVITPFAIASESAAVVLKLLEVRAELIYIDAAHERDPALRDMEAFWDLLTDDGCMIIDDYGYSDVTNAACTFAARVDRPLYASFGKAIVSKKASRRFELSLDLIE